MRNETFTHLRGEPWQARPSAQPVRAGRDSVAVCVEDPDLAEDCLAAAAACGFAPARAALAEVGPGTGIVLYDEGAYRHAGPAAEAALAAADLGVAVCSDLTPLRPGGRDPLALPSGTPALIRVLQEDRAPDLGGRHLVVFGAHGGAGASTFACAAALLAAREREAVLVEACSSGPGLDLLLGLEAVQGMRLGDIHAGTGSIEAEQLWAALPRRGGLAVAASGGGRSAVGRTDQAAPGRGSPESGVSGGENPALAVAHAAKRGGRLVVSDGGVLAERPPGGPAAAPGAARELPGPLLRAADAVVLVVRSTLAGMVQALRVLPRAADSGAAVLVALRRSRGDTLGEVDFLPLLRDPRTRGEGGEAVELCIFRSERRIAAALDGGEGLRPGRSLDAGVRQAWRAAGIEVEA